ncbi:hypothetical protein [Limimaricola litoreus]|uniref:Uncharacterized protein n=1 Tax=Limimaricola litoreus TaxID=2955316 RepID=A0A9X2JPQ6_9RHOB|nr:hypothetical protein [Limimaricola litoreus]MCP1168495.1 hypothetical protein [Limimaricola litoreus]
MADEVRREASGKAIIIGADQSGPALFSDEPTTVERMAFFLEIEVQLPFPKRISLKLTSSDSMDTPIEHSFPASQGSGDKVPSEAEAVDFMLVLNKTEVTFAKLGVYKLCFKCDEDDWVELREFSFPIRKRPTED